MRGRSEAGVRENSGEMGNSMVRVDILCEGVRLFRPRIPGSGGSGGREESSALMGYSYEHKYEYEYRN